MTLKISCTHKGEHIFTEGKEYDVFYDDARGYFLRDDDGDIIESGATPELLLAELNAYWYSQFKLVEDGVEVEPDKITLYIGIDRETSTNIAVSTSLKEVLEKVKELDIYFLEDSEFYANYKNKYLIEEWEV